MAYTYKTEVWINDHNIIGGYGLERPLEYSIQLDGEEIYCGRDVALDQQEATNFTDIFEDYLECEGLAHLQETDYLEWEESAYRKFELYYNDVLQTTFYFLRGYDQFWDYSLYGDYMTPWQGSSQCLSEPINSHIDPRMKILHTDFKATTGETIIWGYVPRVTILTSKIEATAGKQTVHFTIDSNCNYSASTVGDWLIVRPIQATAGTKTFDVYLQGNSGETREGSVVISYRDEYDNLVTETIPVTQYQTHIFYLNPETQTLPASAEDYGSIEVIADGPYFFGIEEDWLSIASISGSSGDTIYTIIPEINTQPSGRTAIITVGLNDYVTVSQEAASISVSPSTIIAQPSAGAYLFEVTSNIPFTATTTQGWITLDQTTGETGVTEIEAAVTNYTGDTDRTAVISIGYLTTAVVVRQEAPRFSVEPSSMELPLTGGTFGFTVTANTEYTISTEASWISLSAVSGDSGITQYTFTAQPNPTINYRSATISVGTASLSLTQEPAYIIVSPETVSASVASSSYTISVQANSDYTISTDAAWITLGASSGTSGVSQFNFTVAESQSPSARTATILVGGKPVTVEQEAYEIVIGFSQEMKVSTMGGTLPFSVTSNYYYQMSADNWITLSANSGASGTTYYTLSINEAPSVSGRTGTVTVGYLTFTVEQTAAEDEYFTIKYNNQQQGSAYSLEKFVDYSSDRFRLYYSINDGGWNEWGLADRYLADFGTNATIRLKGELPEYARIKIYKWSQTDNVSIYGNIASLQYGDNFKNNTTLLRSMGGLLQECQIDRADKLILPATTLINSCYNSMFSGCTTLISAPVLPATTLAEGCYSNMFDSCTSLTMAPALPATTLATRCYLGMFQGCNSLVTAPALPATALTGSCYYAMFSQCTSLTAAPPLPATTLATSCYSSMFQGCASLTTAPVLPATAMTDYCYNGMFDGCASLTTAPALPAATLAYACYAGMFSNCSALISAPILPATTLVEACYYQMFSDCSSLNYVKCLARNFATDSTKYWLSRVAATGTFVKDSNTTWSGGISGIPSGWTVEDA